MTTYLAAPDIELSKRFEGVYRTYFPHLVQVLAPIVGDPSAAEDVAQEAMSRLLIRFDRLDHSTPVWPWLRTVGFRLAIDLIRKRSLEQALDVVPDDVLPHTAHEDRHWCEEGPQLLHALRKLSPRQRTALCLRYVEDRDSQEAAGYLGLKRGAFDQLVFRARRNFRVAYR